MAATWFRFRSEIRKRWPALVGLGVIAGLVGAAVLAAAAGARRADTAYDRMLEATDAPDFVVRTGSASTDAIDPAAVRSLPGVQRVGVVERYYLTTPGPRATIGERTPVLASASRDGRAFYTIGAPKVLEGRLPDPRRADEILVSKVLRDEGGFDVGDDAPLVLAVPDPAAPDGIRSESVRQRVVGVGVTPDQIGLDERRQSGLQMMLTPAFAAAHPDFGIETILEVRVRDAATRAFPERGPSHRGWRGHRRGVDCGRPRPRRSGRAAPGGGALGVRDRARDRRAARGRPGAGAPARARRRRRPHARRARHGSAGPGGARAAAATPVALTAAVVAAVGAVAASPLMPIGPARLADPDPGVAVDGLVVGLGALGVAVVLLAAAAIPAWRLARRRLVADDPGISTTHRARAAERLARLGAPPTAVAGTRFALEPGRGATAVPTRSVLVGVTAAATALVAALVVAANLQHVVDTPSQWGATWDVTVSVATDTRELVGTFDRATLLDAKQQRVEGKLDADRRVEAWTVGAANTVELAGRTVPALGVVPRGGVRPAIVSGRAPRTADEVALGAETLDDLGLELGDTVRAHGHDLRVVGVSVLPRFQPLGGGDEAALKRGAVLTLAGVLDRSPDFFSRAYLVRLTPGTDPTVAARRLRRAIPEAFAFDIAPVAAPEDIEALSHVADTPVLLAAVLGLLALATLAHTLVTSVRRRRRDLAVLVALGFTRRQLRAQVGATVAWQATVVTVVGLAVGLPIGILAGRWAASLFEDRLGVIGDVVVPIGALALLIPVALVAANAVAFVPGRLAAGLRPAVGLRAE